MSNHITAAESKFILLEYVNGIKTLVPTFDWLPEVVKQLNSKLSISLVELNNLFKEVSSSLLGRYDITILPFKIVRNQ
jgi:hypothetical protein